MRWSPAVANSHSSVFHYLSSDDDLATYAIAAISYYMAIYDHATLVLIAPNRH
jgi:hypothetical protein